MKGAVKDFKGMIDPNLEAAEYGKLVEAKSRVLTSLAARQKESHTAGQNVPGLYHEREELVDKQMTLENETSLFQEKLRSLEKTTTDLRSKHQALLQEWKLANIAEALENLDRIIGDLDPPVYGKSGKTGKPPPGLRRLPVPGLRGAPQLWRKQKGNTRKPGHP